MPWKVKKSRTRRRLPYLVGAHSPESLIPVSLCAFCGLTGLKLSYSLSPIVSVMREAICVSSIAPIWQIEIFDDSA